MTDIEGKRKMKEILLEEITHIIDIIYSADKVGLDTAFVELIDSLLRMVEEQGLTANMEFNKILIELQAAYIKKDLVDLADVLSYQLKPFIEE